MNKDASTTGLRDVGRAAQHSWARARVAGGQSGIASGEGQKADERAQEFPFEVEV